MPSQAVAAVDTELLVDCAEISARFALAWMCVPEQPDSFWADFAASTRDAVMETAPMWSNACAVMADATYPIGMES